MLQLRDEGALALTDPLSVHVPSVAGPATLLQLLAHAGGLTSELPGDWWERVPGNDAAGLLAALADEAPRLEAGARLHYSNVGCALLGYYAGERLRVGRDADGVVSHLDLTTFVLTREPYAPAPVVAGGVDARGWHRPG